MSDELTYKEVFMSDKLTYKGGHEDGPWPYHVVSIHKGADLSAIRHLEHAPVPRGYFKTEIEALNSAHRLAASNPNQAYAVVAFLAVVQQEEVPIPRRDVVVRRMPS